MIFDHNSTYRFQPLIIILKSDSSKKDIMPIETDCLDSWH